MGTLKTSYTVAEFLEWLHGELVRQGVLADFLGWSPAAGDYDQALQEVLLAAGVENLSDLDGLEGTQKLRALGRLQLWRQVQEALATEYTYSADQTSHQRSQMFDQVGRLLDRAEREADRWSAAYAVEAVPVSRSDDPYVWSDLDEGEWT